MTPPVPLGVIAQPRSGAVTPAGVYDTVMLAQPNLLGFWHQTAFSATMAARNTAGRDMTWVNGGSATGRLGNGLFNDTGAWYMKNGQCTWMLYSSWMAVTDFEFEIIFKVYPGGGGALIDRDAGTPGRGFQFYMSGGVLTFISTKTTIDSHSFGSGLADGLWHHCVVSHAGGRLKATLDNVLIYDVAFAQKAASTSALAFGASWSGGSSGTLQPGGNPLTGVIEAVAFFSAASSAVNIEARYAAFLNAPRYTPPTATAYDTAVNADSPLFRYKMDEPLKWAMFNAVGTYPLHGEYRGQPVSLGSSIVVGTAQPPAFDNTNTEYGEVADGPAMTTAFSVEFWLSPDDTTARFVAGRWNGSGQFSWRVDIGGGNVNWTLYNGGDNAQGTTGGTHLTVGAAHHLVFTSDGTNRKIYVNGTQRATAAYSLAHLGTGPAYIGRINTSNTPTMRGRMSEFAWYGTALSAARVLAHYNAGI